MKQKSKLMMSSAIALLVVALVAWFFLFKGNKGEEERYRDVQVVRGAISDVVATTGVVEPKNRLKIQSSIAGRIEEIVVSEGEMVRKGQVLALLSSTERAALLDAARLQGKSEEAYWKKVYKETAVLAPLDGQVIVRSIEPGQMVNGSDSLFVLSDRLMVKAFVDETDIGRVKVGQLATIALDAYPDISVRGKVEHIDFESRLQNNVTMYYVDIIPEQIPSVFRSGMSATITIIVKEKPNALLVPLEAVQQRNGQSVVLQRNNASSSSAKVRYRAVQTGLRNEQMVEIVAGLGEQDAVLLPDTAFALPSKKGGTNPFRPQRSPNRP